MQRFRFSSTTTATKAWQGNGKDRRLCEAAPPACGNSLGRIGMPTEQLLRGTYARSQMDAHRGSELLEELQASLTELEQVARRTASAAVDRGSDLAVLQLAETAADVAAIGQSFVAAQRAAAAATGETAATLSALSPDAEWIITHHDEWPVLNELCVLWKAWFFFARALCDNVYRILLAHAESRPARQDGSMNQAAAKPANPVARMLEADAPTFLPWFIAFRDRRNAVKQGVNFACTALNSPGISITFNEFRSDPATGHRSIVIDSDQRRVTLDDVVGDVRQIIDVLTVIASRYIR
jgi:hypothetical protein